MLTTPNMGLKAWNTGNDAFNHQDLVDDWSAIDDHNHAPGKGKQIPAAGIVDATITAGKLASGAALANLGSGTITDVKLTSPNNSVGKLIHQAQCVFPAGVTAGTYTPLSNGSGVIGSGVTNALPPFAFAYNPANFVVPGKTAQWIVRANISSNSASAGGNFTFGYSKVTGIAGGAGVISHSFGAAAGGSILIAAPIGTFNTPSDSSSFIAPALGLYLPTVLTSNTAASNSWSTLTWRLFVVHT